MPIYQCDMCDKVFKQKSNFDHHVFKRKKPCLKKKEGSSIKSKKNTSNKNNIKCNYCNKIFSRSDSLRRHLDNYCKEKKFIENQKEDIYQKLLKQMEAQQNEIKELKEHITKISSSNIITNTDNRKNTKNSHNKNSNNTNNTLNYNQTNNNYNIKLVAFGQEDMDCFSKQEYSKIFHKGLQAVPQFVEYLHFNKNKPEYHNVYISNMRDNYVMVYDGQKWKLSDRTNTINQLMEDKTFYLVEKFEELIKSLNPITIKKFRRFLNQQDEDEVANNIKKELRLILYNNKHIPEETRKLILEDTPVLEEIEQEN